MPTHPNRPHTPIRVRYVIIAVLAALAVAAGFARPLMADDTPKNLSATDRIKKDPPPTLFTPTQIATIAAPTAQQQNTATSLMASWWSTHGTAPDDKAFLTWVENQTPAPPAPAQRNTELNTIKSLQTQRTPAGIAAATWLERNGKKDIWKLYLHDQRELQSPKVGATDKAELKAILKMSKTAADTLGAKYRQSAPYVLEPSLRTDHTVKKGAVCPCSYPSRHATRAAAARTYLGQLAPRRLSDYTWMEDQVDYSRLYMAGHVRSDITAGSRLGDMIGQYFLITRGHTSPPSR